MAANINWPERHCTGSGIYAGRLGALEVFVSQTPMTKVLVAKVPADPQSSSIENNPSESFPIIENPISIQKTLPSYETIEIDANPNEIDKLSEIGIDNYFLQDNMTVFAIEFLDFSKQLHHNGKICQNDTCCHYDIAVNRNRMQSEKV